MNLSTSNQTFKVRSKRPLRRLFAFVWLLLLPFILFLYLPWWSLLLIWLGSFCLLYFFYLREFESALEYQARPVVQVLGGSPCQWYLLTHGGERYALSLHYLGAAVLIWNLKGRWQQIIILRPMLSSDDWRQLQVLLRWSTS